MASDLLTIAASGARAARVALDIAAQNIANAGTEGYVRRTVRLEEMAQAGSIRTISDISLSGVRVAGLTRHADLFRQAEARRTGSDLARANAELGGIEGLETGLEQSGLYPAIVRFEASLQKLSADPVDPALRAGVFEAARTLAETFNLAAGALDGTGNGLRFAAGEGVGQVNLLAGELAGINLKLARTIPGSGDQSALLDQRDLLLERLAGHADVSVSFTAQGAADVRLGGSGGPLLVTGATTSPLAMATAADGTISFTLGGGPVTLGAGALAGQAQALGTIAATGTRLDSLAATLVAAANGAQASGVALDGSPGQPLFAGSSAATLALALTSGDALATAPAGAGPGSRDPAGLTALQNALSGAGVANQMDAILFASSSLVAGRTITRDALGAIADTAATALAAQAGVDLDAEAVSLVRYQQAFQASGKAMQVASTLFDTLLAIR